MPDNPNELARKQELLRKIAIALRNKTPTVPYADTFEEQRLLGDVDNYFSLLYDIRPKEYPIWVGYYVRANQEALKCSQNNRHPQITFPLPLPLSQSYLRYAWVVKDMPHLWELSRQRGRRNSAINDAIERMVTKHPTISAARVCKQLDTWHVAVVQTDRWKKEQPEANKKAQYRTWVEANANPDLRSIIASRISTVKKRVRDLNPPNPD